MAERKRSEGRKNRKRVITDVVMLEISPGKFEYIISPITPQGNLRFPLEIAIQAKLKQHYHNYEGKLPIVAITDGASNIRKRLNNLNNQGVTIILDWYHLCKKIREYLAMIGRNKSEKRAHLKFLFPHLWQGKIELVLNYLSTEVQARNQEKLDELIKYLTKHQDEIIDYESRKQAGKTIGSGRIEKGVDLTIGNRQKHKGMSWRALGSRALAVLKVTEFNGKWHETWFPQAA